uniref:Cysteine-rich DPF motif domain-containing protein 1 n=1 Tax=Corvus moneduloides TaxID=1196302 RepID=A0A8C3E1E0_CORMO
DCSHVLCHLREFKCELCELSALYTYYGQMPPNSHSIVIRILFLIVGSHRSLCSRAVCVGTDCSLFYSKRFRFPCVKENLKAFPLEIQEGMDKRKPRHKSCKKNGYKA